ncbi:hypothetical protein KFK09_022695 [Dendrobium nobile]|uniref:Uncharacterized protein n=1 Tax=Dendrobium nobile TaxID=94219 RepID=A0A8T3AJ50_DENNO|nr:hypothetical protein KFK09_022681 [Dendrobium nobile]KAI0496366.1 hypothetical protein KFK09_022682 [Dendrobium nobile]KAI0496379.1 hypothetical protein KFK09_022695 [Dendrobium nobile]
MGRILLLVPSKELNLSPLHLPLLSALFLLSIITLISALCATHNRKSRARSLPPKSISSSEEQEEKVTVVPATHGPIGPSDPPSPTNPIIPRRKLSMNLSLKLPEGLTRVRTGRREGQEDKERTATDDSTWMKTIILGEKCKVPENGEREDEEIIVYDEKGNRQRNYHPRTPRSMPVSRTNSFTIPSS